MGEKFLAKLFLIFYRILNFFFSFTKIINFIIYLVQSVHFRVQMGALFTAQLQLVLAILWLFIIVSLFLLCSFVFVTLVALE